MYYFRLCQSSKEHAAFIFRAEVKIPVQSLCIIHAARENQTSYATSYSYTSLYLLTASTHNPIWEPVTPSCDATLHSLSVFMTCNITKAPAWL